MRKNTKDFILQINKNDKMKFIKFIKFIKLIKIKTI